MSMDPESEGKVFNYNMSGWLEAELDEVEKRGPAALAVFYNRVDGADGFTDTELQQMFDDSEDSSSISDTISDSESTVFDDELSPSEFRKLIGERIWSKIRPDPTQSAVDRKAMYENEDVQTGWRNPNRPLTDVVTTVYEDRDTLGERRAFAAEDGRVFGPDGQPMNGNWGWVIDDETGYLLFFPPNGFLVEHPKTGEVVERPSGEDPKSWMAQGYKIRTYHHTTPVAGFPVSGAGLVTLEAGYIASINDQSGHYRPEAEELYQSVRQLEDEGYLLQRPAEDGFRDAQITLTGRDGDGRPTDKAEWLDAERAQNPDFPTDNVTLRSEQFLQTEGNERQIRLKQALNQELVGKYGADEDASGVDDDDSDMWSDSSSESDEDPVEVVERGYARDDDSDDDLDALSSIEDDDSDEDLNLLSSTEEDPEGDVSGEGESPDAEQAQVPKVSWDQVDWGFVRRANEALLKDTDAGQSIPFWQIGAGLVIGSEQPLTYRRLFEELRGDAAPAGDRPSGYIRVASRGRLGSRGRIEVNGDYDEQTFKAEVRQFSNKEITFV